MSTAASRGSALRSGAAAVGGALVGSVASATARVVIIRSSVGWGTKKAGNLHRCGQDWSVTVTNVHRGGARTFRAMV